VAGVTRIDLARVAWPEVEAAVARGVLAVLAVGACEQHGPHLPLTTDTDMAQGQAAVIADALGALLLPPVTYGDAWNNEAFAGTVSVSPETLVAMLTDIGRGLRRMGVRGLIVVNGHFGNRAPIAQAAEVIEGVGLPVLPLDYPGLERLFTTICDSAPAGHGFMHADEFETSVMLAVAPDAVRMDRAEASYPVFPNDFGRVPIQLRDFNPTGVFGDPRPATAAKGQAFLDGIAAESLRLIADWRGRYGI
jgi:creatinine amidohydrolase